MSSTVYSSVAPKNYFGQPKTILNDRASEKIDGVKGNDKCNRNTIPHIQLEKSLSAMKHRDNERNMLDHPRICICPRTRLYLGACIIVKRGCWGTTWYRISFEKNNAVSFLLDSKVTLLIIFRTKGLVGTHLRKYLTILYRSY